MSIEYFGKISLFCPRPQIELEMRQASESHLRSKFDVGKYTNRNEINSIVQHQFKFYEKKLEELLPSIASLDFLEFVLQEYENSAQISHLYKQGELNPKEAERWEKIGKIFRRASKYLAERIILLQPDEAPEIEDHLLLETTEKVWLCVEEMIEAYVVSDQTYMVFPEETMLEIFPQGSEKVYHQGLLRNLPDTSRIRIDTKYRHDFIPEPSFISDINKHNEIIGSSIKGSIGIDYFDCIKVLETIIDGVVSASKEFQIPSVGKEELIERVSQILNYPKDSVETVIKGFSLSKEQMDSEGREVWKPKQEYRAYRRAFFECSDSNKRLITFSKLMAKESLFFLIKDAVFKKLPKEWLSPSVTKSLNYLSNEAGKWFEEVVENNIYTCGFEGKRSLKRIGLKEKQIVIPVDIGEIDYIGYSHKENLLLIIECKFVRDSFEPKFFNDDISEFVTAKNSYIKKFRKKVAWVKDNINLLTQALESIKIVQPNTKPKKLAGIMITHTPNFASEFIADYPCVSLTEFMLKYRMSEYYPYEYQQII